MRLSLLTWIKLYYRIRKMFYRYNIKIRHKTIEEILEELAEIYKRLPQTEQKIMIDNINTIMKIYRKEFTNINEE